MRRRLFAEMKDEDMEIREEIGVVVEVEAEVLCGG